MGGEAVLKKQKREKTQSRARDFMSGVLLLSLSTLLVKIIGLVFKIPMLSLLGAEGMGYFNSAYEIYALLCVISTAGLPVALSMLVSRARTKNDTLQIKHLYQTALKLFLSFGILGTAFMLLLARRLAEFIKNPLSWYCIAAIAPALLFICVASAIRGYCQGFENMLPTAVSQLIEALSKLVFGMVFASFAIRKGFAVFEVAAFAILGVSVGTLLSALYLLVVKRKIKIQRTVCIKNVSHNSSRIRELAAIALPITLGSALLGFTRIIDMTLIMRRLQDVGYSTLDANKIYGSYTTLAVPVFSLIPALIAPVAMALVPQLASFLEEKNKTGQSTVIENSMRITTLLSMPASIGLVAFSRPVLEMLFASQSEAIDIAAPLLSVLGASVIFSCIITTTNAILQSYRMAYLPILSMLAGVAVKFFVSYFLIGREGIGAMGAPIGSLACNISVTLINMYFLKKYTSVSFSLQKVFLKPLLASCFSIGSAFALYMYMSGGAASDLISMSLAVLLALVVYFVFMWLIGGVTLEDVKLLPLSEKLRDKILKKGDSEEKNDGCTKEKNASREKQI